MTILYFSATEALWLILINFYTIIHFRQVFRPDYRKKIGKKAERLLCGFMAHNARFSCINDFFQTGVHFMNTTELF